MKTSEETVENHAGKPVEESQRWIDFDARLKKWGALALFIFVAAGLSGVFSHGYLSHVHTASADNSIAVDYERFGRILSDMDIKIIVTPPRAGRYSVTLNEDFTDGFEVLTLHPAPVRARSAEGRLTLEYENVAGSPRQTIWLGLHPRSAGAKRINIALDGEAAVSFFQLIYP